MAASIVGIAVIALAMIAYMIISTVSWSTADFARTRRGSRQAEGSPSPEPIAEAAHLSEDDLHWLADVGHLEWAKEKYLEVVALREAADADRAYAPHRRQIYQLQRSVARVRMQALQTNWRSNRDDDAMTGTLQDKDASPRSIAGTIVAAAEPQRSSDRIGLQYASGLEIAYRQEKHRTQADALKALEAVARTREARS